MYVTCTWYLVNIWCIESLWVFVGWRWGHTWSSTIESTICGPCWGTTLVAMRFWPRRHFGAAQTFASHVADLSNFAKVSVGLHDSLPRMKFVSKMFHSIYYILLLYFIAYNYCTRGLQLQWLLQRGWHWLHKRIRSLWAFRESTSV